MRQLCQLYINMKVLIVKVIIANMMYTKRKKNRKAGLISGKAELPEWRRL